MRVVVGSRYSFQLTGSHEFSGEDRGTSFDALTAIVGEFHRLLVELDTVTEDAEDGTCTHDIGVKSLLLEVSKARKQK